jgi:cobalt-zinc-cadmium efflux system outer membrane protein
MHLKASMLLSSRRMLLALWLLPLMAATRPCRAQDQKPLQPAAATDVAAASGPTEIDVFKLWLRTSREITGLRAQIGEARFDVVTSELWPNPQLGISGSIVTVGRDHPPGPLYNWAPQLSVPLPIFGQISARKREALAALHVAEVNVAAALWSRAADLEQALVERAFADAEVLEIQRNQRELMRIDTIVQARAAAGANPRYDVLRVSTTAATFRAALAAAIAKRDKGDAEIVALMAAPEVTQLAITRAGLAPFRGPENAAQLVALALQRRPDLLLAQRGVTAAQATASRYRSENTPIPSLQLGALVSHSAFSVSPQAGLAITLPLFDRNQGLIGRAQADAAGQTATAEGLQARIRAEVNGDFQVRADARAALEEFRSGGLNATAELLQRAEVSYQAGGDFSILDLLDAYRAVWEARAQELELERTFADAEADLERAAALMLP